MHLGSHHIKLAFQNLNLAVSLGQILMTIVKLLVQISDMALFLLDDGLKSCELVVKLLNYAHFLLEMGS